MLVDDQLLIRHGLKSLLNANSDLQVVGDAENGQQAIAQVKALYPDVVLMDIRMPIMDGVAATRVICEQFPETRVLMLTTFDDDEYVAQAMQFGAKGYLLKDTPPDELATAIRSIYKGYTHLGPGLFEKAMANSSGISPLQSAPVPPQLAQLTPREREVLNLIATGANNREIAAALCITERTVKNYVTKILSCLNLRDRTQAAVFAHTFLSNTTQ
ncbi:response regulator transcription factor [Oscillatoria sp. FACHB-1407]|uniref:response regulator transcription factor n=1 Tax=Oscillatoria sp. FACHB-1407 TaxID=2692847 RepID=UPI001F548EE1|nr:response regulator transcription factor [Oscillatoria sp. FACHB-1407]